MKGMKGVLENVQWKTNEAQLFVIVTRVFILEVIAARKLLKVQITTLRKKGSCELLYFADKLPKFQTIN